MKAAFGARPAAPGHSVAAVYDRRFNTLRSAVTDRRYSALVASDASLVCTGGAA